MPQPDNENQSYFEKVTTEDLVREAEIERLQDRVDFYEWENGE